MNDGGSREVEKARVHLRSGAVVLILAILLTVSLPLQAQEEDPRLETLLRRLSRTAELFRDTTLQFACTEEFRWRGAGDPGEATFEYVFVYDDENGFEDYRTTPFHGKRRKAPAEISPSDRGVPWFLRSAYLWIFVFRESRQGLHHYRIVGEEEVLGVDAVLIEFEPIPPIQPEVNDWYGVAWVDPALGQLLKVVALEPDDHQIRRKFEDTWRSNIVDEARAEYSTVTTVFTQERSGLRFPGKVTLENARYRWRKKPEKAKEVYKREGGRNLLKERPAGVSRKKVLMRVEQTYRDYRFFSVRTVDEVENYILRRRTDPSP